MTPIDHAIYEVLGRYVVQSEWATTNLPPLTLYLPDTEDKRRYPCLAVTAMDINEEPFTVGLLRQDHEYEIACYAEQSSTCDSYSLAQQLADKVKLVLRRQRLAIAPASTVTSIDLAKGATLIKVEDQTQVGEIMFIDMPSERLWRTIIRREREVAGGPFVWLTLSSPLPYPVQRGTPVYSPRCHPWDIRLQTSRPAGNGLLWEATVNYRFAITVYAAGCLEAEYE
jgi:hypothetical protein